LQQTLERVWERMGQLALSTTREPLVLRPRQEQLLQLLAQGGGMTPAAIREALKVSKQGAMDLLRTLLQAGLVQRIGTLKTGRYILK
jgi:DNA-binding MarR family transcriptional regulator